MFPTNHSTQPQIGQSSTQHTNENTHPDNIRHHDSLPCQPSANAVQALGGSLPAFLPTDVNTESIEPLSSLPISGDTHTRLTEPCWWIYEPGSDFDTPGQRDRLSALGAGFVRYVTENTDSSNPRKSRIWVSPVPTLNYIVWKADFSTLAIPKKSFEIKGLSWSQRREAPGSGRGKTLRNAALREVKHLEFLQEYHSTQDSTLGENHGSQTYIPGLRSDTGSQADFIADLLNRKDLQCGERHKADQRYSYEGDIYHDNVFVSTRRWVVELVISNYDFTRLSTFEPEKLTTIIENAVNYQLDAGSVDLHISYPSGEGAISVSRSWYLATDAGQIVVDDQIQDCAESFVPPSGVTRSARPVLMLVMTVLPSREEFEEGFLGPPELGCSKRASE